ncbi:MAG: AMP-dependent synthetase/ligase [Acidimicrobiales bacterium]
MREASGRAIDPLPPEEQLLRPIMRRAAAEPSRVVASYRRGDRFVDVTAAEFRDRVWALARGFIASGVQPGDRVALMAHTRIEWPQVDYAILAAGGVTVPIYETSSTEQVHWVLADSGAVMAVLETPAMKSMFDEVATTVPDCREALVIDDGALDELARRGDDVDAAAVDERVEAVTTDSIATIIYTSGTTGRPKGCILTQRNLRTNAKQALEGVETMLGHDERALLFLPLAHSLAKIIMLVCIEHGITCAFSPNIAKLVEEMGMTRPTLVVAVPRVFEKVWNSAQHKAHSEKKGFIFDRAASTAVDWSRQLDQGKPGMLTKALHSVFDRLVYSKLRGVFGGELRYAFSGGGPLGERLTNFFRGIGVEILEGYGLTETSPVLTLNRPGAWRPGTVGQPVAGTTIRIADDGEILAKGPQVFQGYWHNDTATAEIIDGDGWFHTGDIGELDDDGFLKITGRKKDLIVTAAGKNVAPAPLEDILRAHALVSQAVVVGDGRPFIAALLTLDEEAATQWAQENDKVGLTAAELAADDQLRTQLQAAVDEANRFVSRAESIRKFAVLERDLSIDAGELTPTLKVRRVNVEKGYAEVIEAIYTK